MHTNLGPVTVKLKLLTGGRDGSVGIATGYEQDGPGIKSGSTPVLVQGTENEESGAMKE
jgi:hypothetical protein